MNKEVMEALYSAQELISFLRHGAERMDIEIFSDSSLAAYGLCSLLNDAEEKISRAIRSAESGLSCRASSEARR